jgi:hypothetical protein
MRPVRIPRSPVGSYVGTHRIACVLAVSIGCVAVPAVAYACTCMVDKDAMRQRSRDVQKADLVFEGTVVRKRVLQAASWSCEFDDGSVGEISQGCLRVRTVNGACEPWQGIKIVIRDSKGEERRRAYTRESGTVEFCKLDAGRYRIEGSAPTLETSVREVEFSRRHDLVLLSLSMRPGREFLTVLAVEHQTKGPSFKEVEIRTWENDGSCGFGAFESRKRYEVFATSGSRWPPDNAGSLTGVPPSKVPSGVYVVDLCGGTKVLEDVAPPSGRRPTRR